jgi:beta-glucosidase
MSGEDPHLGAALVGPAVQGIQSNGVIATAKHYILNNQEDHRGNMSSNADERTLMELYFPPFQSAVKAGVGSIMCGYNKVNGDWACENKDTLTAKLRGIAGFKGFVMSDWGATHSTVKAAEAGLTQEMPGQLIIVHDVTMCKM